MHTLDITGCCAALYYPLPFGKVCKLGRYIQVESMGIRASATQQVKQIFQKEWPKLGGLETCEYQE